MAPLARLRRCIGLLTEIDDADASWMAEVLATLTDLRADNDNSTFADAAGLPSRWRQAARIDERDRRLRDLALRHFPGLSGRELAAAVAQAVRRYQGSSWPRDASSGRRPSGLTGEIFDLLQLGEIPCGSQLRSVFNGVSGRS